MGFITWRSKIALLGQRKQPAAAFNGCVAGCVAKNILRRESSLSEFWYAAIWKRLAINSAWPTASFLSK
jgi:hypothetical protein